MIERIWRCASRAAFGTISIALVATAVSAPAVAADDGAQLYTQNCAACHQGSGEGLPNTFPPLKGDPVVDNSDPTEHIRTVLFGAQGRDINGIKYSVPMPAFSGSLNDDQIAAIINHERSSWGNNATQVTADEVATQRAKP